jgi:hypothetical protein
MIFTGIINGWLFNESKKLKVASTPGKANTGDLRQIDALLNLNLIFIS